MHFRRRIRSWLGLGPTRAELIAEALAWKTRCKSSNEARDAAYARAKAAERLAKTAGRMVRDGLNEPDRVQGCAKVRFHQQIEAESWAAAIAADTGESVRNYNTYACKTCPRSPVSLSRYWHVGHVGSMEAQIDKDASKDRRIARHIAARRDGATIEQRIDPRIMAKLRGITERGR
jgi:hypothetical protein